MFWEFLQNIYTNDIFLILCPSIFWHQIEFLMPGIFSMKNIKWRGVPLVLHPSAVMCAHEWLWTLYSCANCCTAHFSSYASSARHWKTWPHTSSNLQHLSSSVPSSLAIRGVPCFPCCSLFFLITSVLLDPKVNLLTHFCNIFPLI